MNSAIRNVAKSHFIFNFVRQPLIHLPCSSTNINFSTLQKSDFYDKKSWKQSCINSQVHMGAPCLNKQMIRCKTNKRKSTKKENKDDGSDDDDDSEEEEDDDEASYSDLEIDYEAPAAYKHMSVHSQRADSIIHTGLGISKSETEKLFYGSKFMFQGKTLTKKAKQLEVGDTIDVIHSRKDDKLLVQRVKVIKVSKRLTKSGKPVVILRVWRKQFEVNSPGGS